MYMHAPTISMIVLGIMSLTSATRNTGVYDKSIIILGYMTNQSYYLLSFFSRSYT